MTISNRGKDWDAFQQKVLSHIENYTVPQYGDKGADLASDYSSVECLQQVKKYLSRAGRNSRPGQQRLDLLKMAHYIQMGFDALEREEAEEPTSE